LKHLQRDLEQLKKDILTYGAMVEESINGAITALLTRRSDLAQEIIQGDDKLDQREVAIEEFCLKVLALHQPVAVDLRFIIAVMKVNNDLERMGDLAVNIAERARYLSTHDPLQGPLDFSAMTRSVQTMVRESLDALIHLDTALARQVLTEDEEVDDMNRGMYDVLQKIMAEDPSTIKRAVHTLSASRHLERIADLATNIAEDVVFMVDGDIVRHQSEDYEE